MREILFRGKRTDNGEWAIGDLYRQTDYFGERQTIIFEDKGNACFKKNFVDTETVCQYTGLTDKNGNKIFEGDIVKDEFAQLLGVVKYSKKYMQFVVDDINDGEQDYSEFINEVEVIGNIFDNPELLEVKNG